tara:strand:+ start:262 stop:522 length:261 start_codon:yes stop_codon:yes gene_type:complete
MSERYRIDVTRWLEGVYEKEKPGERHEHQDYIDDLKTLLWELERCYEEIDTLRESINAAHEVMEKYSNEEIDNVCDAYEEVCLALD